MNTLTDIQLHTLAADFHTTSTEDIVGLFAIAKDVFALLHDEDATREEALRVVRALLDTGMCAGNPPYSPGGWQPWPDQTPETVLARIRAEWHALGRRPNIPDIAWFGPPPASTCTPSASRFGTE